MSTMLNNPTVGSRGLWKLNNPFHNLLPVNTPLTCTAISNYGQLINMGTDVLATYYRKYSLPDSLFQEHMDKEGRIIFLKTDPGTVYSFPLHYLESYPIGTGVAYVTMGIGIRLGALPKDENIEALIEQFQELANLQLGVDIQAESMVLSDIYIVDNVDHERIKNVRKEKKKEKKPTLERLLELTNTGEGIKTKLRIAEEKVIEYYNKIQELENEIKRLKNQP